MLLRYCPLLAEVSHTLSNCNIQNVLAIKSHGPTYQQQQISKNLAPPIRRPQEEAALCTLIFTRLPLLFYFTDCGLYFFFNISLLPIYFIYFLFHIISTNHTHFYEDLYINIKKEISLSEFCRQFVQFLLYFLVHRSDAGPKN